MKVLTWNINGIRSSNREIPLKKLLDSLEADIICLQETKVTRDQLDEVTAIVEGYHAFFSFSKVKGGYSGVATYCKTSCTPKAVEEGLTGLLTEDSSKTTIKCYGNDALSLTTQELLSLDGEGRAILSEHDVTDCKPLVIINLYCPRADRDNDERWTYKQNFYRLVQARCEALLSCKKNVMIVGDFNVSHTKLDHCDPDIDPEYFSSNESRIWMSQFLLPLSKLEATNDTNLLQAENDMAFESINQAECDEDDFRNYFHSSWQKSTITRNEFHNPSTAKTNSGSFIRSSLIQSADPICKEKAFVDLFRYFYPNRENAFTCWSTVTNARKTNYGTRIDYILVNTDFLMKHALSCDIRPDIHGSDHCPVEACFSCEMRASTVIPDLCSVFMPEFKGKQKSIRAFLRTKSSNTDSILRKSQLFPDVMPFGTNNVCNERSQEIKDVFVTKRKSEQELTKNPAKLRRKASVDKKSGKKSGLNLLSYFQKPQGITNNMRSNNLMSFLKDARVKDTELQDEILRDCVVGYKEEGEQCNGNLSSTHEGTSEHCSSLESYIEDFTEKRAISNTQSKVQKCRNQGQDGALVKAEHSKLRWKSILKGPDPPPLCDGHKEDCVLRTVKKQGPTLGKQFYCCARPDGRADDKEARCKTFIWKRK